MKPRNRRRPSPYAPRLTRVLVALLLTAWLAGVWAMVDAWIIK